MSITGILVSVTIGIAMSIFTGLLLLLIGFLTGSLRP